MKLTTPHAETVKAAFLEYAKMMDAYASDQLASQRWQSHEKNKAACRARAGVYEGIAAEIRELEFVEETT